MLLHDRYQIVRILGQGGMGAVYLAYDQSLATQVAVKINRSPSPKAASQFISEARLLATLRHPNLPRVIDYFQEGGAQFLVMDYIAGEDLKERTERTGIPPVQQVLAWAAQLGSALSYLHRQSPPVIHRDIKPANLKLSPQNEVILVDFGIAKATEANQATTTGAAAFSPGYAPPEQYGGARTGAYSDQYSMAATLYHLLTGQKPADALERLMGTSTVQPAREFNPLIPVHVEQALMRAMAVRPEARFANIDEFVAALGNPAGTAPQQPANYPSPEATLYTPRTAPLQPGGGPAYAPPGATVVGPGAAPYPGAPGGTGPYAPPPVQTGQDYAATQVGPGVSPPAGTGPVYPGVPGGAYPPQTVSMPAASGPYSPQPQGMPAGAAPYPARMGAAPYPVALPRKRSPWPWVIGIGAVVIVAVGAIFALGREKRTSEAPTATLLPAVSTSLPTQPPAGTAQPTSRLISPTALLATATPPLLASATTVRSSTPVPTSPPVTAPTVIPYSAGFQTIYLTYFQERPQGFAASEWDVTVGADSKVGATKGLLNVVGSVQAFNETDFDNNIRVYLGDGIYGIGLKEFTIYVDWLDISNHMKMACSDQASGSGQVLRCEWFQMVGGTSTRLENTSADLCSGRCVIEIEIDGSNYRVYADNKLKIAFRNTSFKNGKVGIYIANPSGKTFTLDQIVIYNIPKTADGGETLVLENFGDDWTTSHVDDDYAVIDRELKEDAYTWTMKAKKGFTTRVSPSSLPNLPPAFTLYVDAQRLSGPTDVAYGVVFRYQDSKNYYYFAVRDNKTVSVHIYLNGEWTTLVKSTPAASIEPGEVNYLKVRGEGYNYTFYVNDTIVAKMTDETFKGGSFGLIAELSANQQAVVEFSWVQVDRQ